MIDDLTTEIYSWSEWKRRNSYHDNVVAWKCFMQYWSFMRGCSFTDGFSRKGPIMRGFGVVFVASLSKLLNRQSSYRWFEMTCNGERNCVMSANHQPINMIWRVWRQKQVFQTWISNRIPQNIVGRNYLSMPVMPVFWHQSPPICYGCYIFLNGSHWYEMLIQFENSVFIYHSHKDDNNSALLYMCTYISSQMSVFYWQRLYKLIRVSICNCIHTKHRDMINHPCLKSTSDSLN